MNNKSCPACVAVGHDRTGDHLFLMEDGETWHCNKPYHDPYFERDGDEYYEKKSKTLNVKHLPILGSKERCISKETHEYFRVRTEVSETDRSPVALYYPELSGGSFVGYKQRKLPKKFFILSDKGKESKVRDLFGQHKCPKSGKRLLITAGEEDCLAGYEMLKRKYPEHTPCVVGLPRAETGVAPVAENLDFISAFDEVILAMDMDEAGDKARSTFAPIIGEKTRILNLSENDISDMLTKGKEKEFYNAYFSAKEYRPAHIVGVEDILEEAVTPVPWGLSYPWPRLTRLTYGLKEAGEIIGIGGAPGSGKTTIWNQLQKHTIFEHRERIAVFDIEEGPVYGLKKLIGSTMGLPIHKPDCEYDRDKAFEIGQSFGDLVKFYGGDSENWDEVESAIRYFISKGIRFYFIDPLSALVEHLPASEGNTELGRIMRTMRKFRKHHGVTFFHANHLNNPKGSKDHGEGGRVKGSQFSGSRAQWKYSTLLLGLERDQFAEEEDQKHESVLRVIKDRLGGNTGIVNLKYNIETGNMEENYEGDILKNNKSS